MKINRLVIYGYGQFNDLTIEFDSSLHVLYGANEAGKSTILSFIETMLFGFPKRQQNELAYEPKSGAVHGGKLELDLGADGTLVIERIRGRKPQESTIVHNGNAVGEEGLKRLLHGIDRPVFQHLFSARLEQLHALAKLNEEALDRFLLGAGISGDWPIHELEETLEKKQGSLFKPQGRKPLINQTLQELKSFSDVVKKQSAMKEAYEQLASEKRETEKQLEALACELKTLDSERRRWEKAMAMKPLYDEKQSLERMLEKLPPVFRFPEDGLARFDRFKARLLELDGELSHMEQADVSLPAVDETLLGYRTAVKQKRELAERYRANEERIAMLKEELRREEEWIADMFDQLGSGWSEEQLQACLIGDQEEEAARRLAKEINERRSQMAYLQEEFTSLKQKIAEAETVKPARNVTAWLSVSVLSLFGSLLSFVAGREGLALVLLMITTMVSIFFYMNRRQEQGKFQLEQWTSRHDELVRQYKEMEKKLSEKTSAFNELADRFGFRDPVNADSLVHHLRQIREAKKRLRSMKKTRNQLRKLADWLDNYEREIRDLANVFRLEDQEDVFQLLIKMEAVLEEEEKKKQTHARLAERKQAKDRQIESIRAKMKQYEQALEGLLKMAGCDNEESFREKGRILAEREKIAEKIKLIEHQILVQFPDDTKRGEIVRLLEREKDVNRRFIEKLDQKRIEIEQEKSKRLKRLAEIQVELQKMVNSGDVEMSIQQFEMKKSVFRDYVKDWAVQAIALDLLKKTKEKFRKDRLPQVISLAETYFAEITDGAYRRIQMPIDGRAFVVESAEGMRFLPKELSRGTQEQLYLSLRLALTEVYPSDIRFPLLLDDILVHFDKRRRKKGIDVIKNVAGSRQVLFFTCHDHIASEFHRQALIPLSSPAASVPFRRSLR